MSESFSGPVDPPQVPSSAPSTNPDAMYVARFGKELDAWLDVWKQSAADHAVAVALAASRADKGQALAEERMDTAKALADERGDTDLKVRTDAVAVRLALSNAREDTDRATEVALRTALHAAYIDTTQKSLDRALTRLNVFTGAITAVTAIYTTMLGLSYSLPTATDADGIPLDYSAFVPVIFLGGALLLVTIYAALFRKHREARILLPAVSNGQMVDERLITFMDWCFAGILARRWALHGGILSFALGLATLPMAFVDVNGIFKGVTCALGVAGVVAVCVASAKRDKDSDQPSGGIPDLPEDEQQDTAQVQESGNVDGAQSLSPGAPRQDQATG